MSTKTLFPAWRDKAKTRQWFPVGRPDVDVEATGIGRRQAEVHAKVARYPDHWAFCPFSRTFPAVGPHRIRHD